MDVCDFLAYHNLKKLMANNKIKYVKTCDSDAYVHAYTASPLTVRISANFFDLLFIRICLCVRVCFAWSLSLSGECLKELPLLLFISQTVPMSHTEYFLLPLLLWLFIHEATSIRCHEINRAENQWTQLSFQFVPLLYLHNPFSLTHIGNNI